MSHSFLRLAMAFTFVGCGDHVTADPTEAGTASGAGGSSAGAGAAAAGGAASGTASGASSAAGGAPDTGPIPPLACAAGEGVLVAATGASEGTIAVRHDGEWVPPTAMPVASRLAAYVDVYHHVGVFWIGAGDDLDQARFTTTYDGSVFEQHDSVFWKPEASGDLLAAGPGIMIGAVAGGTGAAFFDPDATEWKTLLGPKPFAASSATASSSTGVALVSRGGAGVLCDLRIDGYQWSSVHCHDDQPVSSGGEIPLQPPQVVALPNGTLVAVYYPHSGALAATTSKGFGWSRPVTTESTAVGIGFAAAATPGGDVVVGAVSTAGEVSALRYHPDAGWSPAVHVGHAGAFDRPIAAAPGVCGDDALFAYASGAEGAGIEVARVQGYSSETTTVADLGGPAARVALTTRAVTR